MSSARRTSNLAIVGSMADFDGASVSSRSKAASLMSSRPVFGVGLGLTSPSCRGGEVPAIVTASPPKRRQHGQLATARRHLGPADSEATEPAPAEVGDKRLLPAAVDDTAGFTAQLLTSTGPVNGLLPTPVDTTQIAYGADARVARRRGCDGDGWAGHRAVLGLDDPQPVPGADRRGRLDRPSTGC